MSRKDSRKRKLSWNTIRKGRTYRSKNSKTNLRKLKQNSLPTSKRLSKVH
jgi:hypothetical protein